MLQPPSTDTPSARAASMQTSAAHTFSAQAPSSQAPSSQASASQASASQASSVQPPSDQALVPFVSVQNMMRLVNQIGVQTMMREMVPYLRDAFMNWPNFDKTPRVASHSDVGVIELMPTSDGHQYGFKYVNGHPRNTADGLQTVTAFGLLADVATGYPVLLTEMTLLTALRTAATSALATQALAPQGAQTLALIGAGAQSEFQALALKAVRGINTVRLFDTDPDATAKAVRNLSGLMHVVPCTSAEAAIEGAEVITTCTADKRQATILSDNMIGAGVHINAIGGDCPGKTELQKDILFRADVFVEYEHQTRIEGEIQQVPADFPVTELWQVLSGARPGRVSGDQITLFDGVGFAIEDFAALRYLNDKIAGTPYIDKLDMLADPDDPRDLFGMLGRAAEAA